MFERIRSVVRGLRNTTEREDVKVTLDKLAKRVRALEEGHKDASLKKVLDKLDAEYKKHPGRWDRVKMLTEKALADAGVSSGKMLEIGGRANPRNNDFPGFAYFALDLQPQPESPVPVEVGDITNCPNIPDNSYDFVFSFDVFEHINMPWKAASEITRILRPGGITVVSTLFSWRYHPCPGDYFRYTPEGLQTLFAELNCIYSGFDYTERRRNIIGTGGNRVTPDQIGGWRENVRVNYAGVKPA